jgi:hypothetical protein
MSSYKTLIAMVFLLHVAFIATAQAQVIELQQLQFGEWVVTDNATEQTVTVNTDGSSSNSSGLIMLQSPQEGVYRIEGLLPFSTIIGFDIVMTEPMDGPGVPTFSMDSFQTSADPVDGNGETILRLGATARTTGDGQGYPDGTYNGELTIDINL